MTISEPKSIDVFGVGNALIDILAFVDDQFIEKQHLSRGAMTLVDNETQGNLLYALEHIPVQLRSGGSAANTMIALAQSGGSGYYSGKVAADANGEFYRKDMLESGIYFDVPPAPSTSGATGSCLVLTTPDAERTLCTNLGVSTQLSVSDIDLEKLSHCQYSYIEGYLWDAVAPREASIVTMEHSKRLGVKVAFTFSDMFLIERFSDDFQDLVKDYCDVLFCNAEEVRHFCQTESLTECADQLGKLVELALITDSGNGCLVVENQVVNHVFGFPVQPLDTVGAGDAFAGGVLFGLTHGLSAVQAARWGNYLGSQVVQIQGPRLEGSQADKVQGAIL